MSESRSAILQRLHTQATTQSAVDIQSALTELGHSPEPELDTDNVITSFCRRLLLNRAHLELAPDRSAAVQCISRYLYTRHNSRRVVAGYDPKLAAMPWRDGGVLVRFGAATPDDTASISYGLAGVAEAGSILLSSDRANPASNTWLISEHLVIVDVADLVSSYDQALAKLDPQQLRARGLHFVAGPSSTGDIVGHIVNGAHGPQDLHVILRGHLEQSVENEIRGLLPD